jgi:mono/diheme cytochrome c family protein
MRMHRKGRWVPVALIAVAVLCLGGYALAHPGGTPRRSGWFAYAPLARATTAAPTRSTGVVVCDRAIGYRTLRALGRAASSIAVLAPTSITKQVSTVGVPVTITRVRVLETLAGKRLASVIWLRQTGSATAVPSGGCEPLVSSKQRYLAYLAPFTSRLGGPQIDSHNVVVGGSRGLFELRTRAPAPAPAPLPTKPPVSPSGQTVIGQAGCLACHRLGDSGNDGPGQDLTGLGNRLSATAIRRALVNPTAPMPSYRSLTGHDLRALVNYLAHLR